MMYYSKLAVNATELICAHLSRAAHVSASMRKTNDFFIYW